MFVIQIRAGTHALFFARKADDWGRMFSYNPLIHKLCPTISEYDILREAAMKYHDRIKVFIDLGLRREFMVNFKLALMFLKAILEEQLKTYDPKHERHFLDMCFKKMDETKDDPNSTYNCELYDISRVFVYIFQNRTIQLLDKNYMKIYESISTDQQLIVAMSDFFMPALIANAIQFQFLLQRFYLQPEILEKCQNEIEKVVGHGRLPTLNDRQK